VSCWVSGLAEVWDGVAGGNEVRRRLDDGCWSLAGGYWGMGRSGEGWSSVDRGGEVLKWLLVVLGG
jgi:hypothetical protein